MYKNPLQIIEDRKKYLFPNTYHFYKNPPHIVKGNMQYLYDSNGKEYIDFFAGVSVMNCGHCNIEIINATINQMKELQHTTIIYLTQPIVDLAEKMAKILPGNINRSFFCCTGSEANEGALLLARLYNGKKEFITFEGSLHGRTYLTMNTTAIPMWRVDPFLDNIVNIVPRPHNHNLSVNEASKTSLNEIESLLEKKSNKISAMIVEPIQGNGGIIVPPKWYFKKLKEILEKYDVLLIVDEVQTGFARTGKMFAIENYNVVPDILTCAKALGNGMPISAFCTNDKIAEKFNKSSASTLGGNPVSSTSAIAVLNYIEKYDLIEKAYNLGNKLITGLKKLMSKYPIIWEVRGLGLMVGAELANKDGKPNDSAADFILEKMKDRGFIIGKNGIARNVLAFQPPLVINEKDISLLLYNLDIILKNCSI